MTSNLPPRPTRIVAKGLPYRKGFPSLDLHHCQAQEHPLRPHRGSRGRRLRGLPQSGPRRRTDKILPFHFEDSTCTACHMDPHTGEFKVQMAAKRANGTAQGCEALPQHPLLDRHPQLRPFENEICVGTELIARSRVTNVTRCSLVPTKFSSKERRRIAKLAITIRTAASSLPRTGSRSAGIATWISGGLLPRLTTINALNSR